MEEIKLRRVLVGFLAFSVAIVISRVISQTTFHKAVKPAMQSLLLRRPEERVSVEMQNVPGVSDESFDGSLLQRLETNMTATMLSEIDSFMKSPGHPSVRPTFLSESAYLQNGQKRLAVIQFHFSDGTEIAYVNGLSGSRLAMITCSAYDHADPLQGKCADKIAEVFGR